MNCGPDGQAQSRMKTISSDISWDACISTCLGFVADVILERKTTRLCTDMARLVVGKFLVYIYWYDCDAVWIVWLLLLLQPISNKIWSWQSASHKFVDSILRHVLLCTSSVSSSNSAAFSLYLDKNTWQPWSRVLLAIEKCWCIKDHRLHRRIHSELKLNTPASLKAVVLRIFSTTANCKVLAWHSSRRLDRGGLLI